jgi:CDP-diacylglycerol--glycerol-3-phosphate 3-phosphatidyltransferase
MKFKLNIPNILTLARILCTPIVIVLCLVPIPYGIGYLVAAGVYLLACFTDFLDGHIARKYNMITDFGKFMDQIADKFITTTAMIIVLLTRPDAILPLWAGAIMVLIVVLRDILLSGVRMVASNQNVVIPADVFGKIKSFFLDAASFVLLIVVGIVDVGVSCSVTFPIKIIGIVLMAIGVALAVFSCINYSINAVRAIEKNRTNVQ